MVGGYALRYMLDHPGIACVTSIGRRKLGISYPKLCEVLHQDFSDCSALVEVTSGQDACVFCLGTYTGTVPDSELRWRKPVKQRHHYFDFMRSALSKARNAVVVSPLYCDAITRIIVSAPEKG